jgi:hypothetical protein
MKVLITILFILFIAIRLSSKEPDCGCSHYSLSIGTRLFYSHYSQGAIYHEIGFSYNNKLNSYKAGLLKSIPWIGDLRTGLEFEYLHDLGLRKLSLKPGLFISKGRGEFYYSWGKNTSPLDRLFTKQAIDLGTVLAITPYHIYGFNITFSYRTGFQFSKKPVYFNTFGLDLNYSF